MSAYALLGSLVGGIGWFQFMTVFDPRLMEPLTLIGCLAWMTAIGWAIGLFKKVGHPLE